MRVNAGRGCNSVLAKPASPGRDERCLSQCWRVSILIDSFLPDSSSLMSLVWRQSRGNSCKHKERGPAMAQARGREGKEVQGRWLDGVGMHGESN